MASTLENGHGNHGKAISVPPSIGASSAQDASLPSPSLSPITAAANMNRSKSQSESKGGDHVRQRHYLKQNSQAMTKSKLNRLENINEDPASPQLISQAQSPHADADVPHLVSSFDNLPDKMKSYLMFHFLKRCSKPTLQFVAGVVDPAIRCDFLKRLPVELSLNVLRYLDARSMCRAAQVSRKWRQIVDSDESSWKSLIHKDGFRIPSGEIQRAIQEGWGWQFPGWQNVSLDYERNLGLHEDRGLTPDAFNTLTRQDASSIAAADSSPVLSVPVKRKRKGQSHTQNKKQKRVSSSGPYVPTTPWMSALEHSHGPVAMASAAAATVPEPNVGLPSLRNMHLFKTLYQRHHMMKSYWMNPKTKPHHIAFRAHQRHVVTCLQFDSHKILTGSDDSNIDIYDTKSGASLRRLRGHEGGVWALEYQDNLLVSGSTDRTVRVWDMRDGRMLHVFQGHTSTVRCLQILKPTKVGQAADGRPIMMPPYPLIITGSRDSTCRVWKLPSLGDASVMQDVSGADQPHNRFFQRVLQGHTNSVRAIAAHADTLVSGSYDSHVRVWQVSTGECKHRLSGHSSKVYSVVLDYARGRCISGSMDNSVKVWSLESGTCLFNLEGHTSLVGLLDLRDDILVSAAADATLRVWEPELGRCRNTLEAHTGAITCFLHDGQKIISGSDRTLKMWDTKTGDCVRDLLTDLSGVWQIKFDERRCIAAVQRDDWTYIEVFDFVPWAME